MSRVSEKQSIETGIIFSLITILVGYYTHENTFYLVSAAFLLISLLTPSLLKPLAIVWFGLSKAMGWVTSRILLFIIFCIVVTPMGMIRKLLGKDTLQLGQFRKEKLSAYINRQHEYIASDLKYPF